MQETRRLQPQHRNVLVGLADHGAPRILSWVADLVGFGDSVRIVEAYEPRPVAARDWPVPVERGDLARAAADRHLRYAASGLRLRRHDLAVDARLVDGSAARALTAAAAGVDLVIVGAPQREQSRRALVALLRASRCPVLVVGSQAAGQVIFDGPVQVLLRDARTDSAALALAFEQAHARRVGLAVVRAWQPSFDGHLVFDETAEQKALDESLVPYAEGHPDVGVSVELRAGTAASVVEDTCRSTPLLVMGAEEPTSSGSGELDPALTSALRVRSGPVLVVP